MTERIEVVAGILIDEQQRILITERVDDGAFHGLWEFPGGKISAGETPSQALLRELIEEIGIRVTQYSPYMQLQHDYSDRCVDLRFFRVTEWQGEVQGLEGQKTQWLLPHLIDSEKMLPADTPVLEALRREQPISK